MSLKEQASEAITSGGSSPVPKARQKWRSKPVYAAISTGYHLTQMGCNFLILRWIPPELMGMWLSATVIQSYTIFLRLGVTSALNRELPFHSGKGDPALATIYASTAGAFSATLGLLNFAVFFFAGLIAAFRGEVNWSIALTAMAFQAISGELCSFYEATFRGSRGFQKLAKVHATNSLILIATVGLVAWLGYVGMGLRVVINALTILAMTYWVRPIRVPLRFHWKQMKELILMGQFFTLKNTLLNFSQNIPRTMLLVMGGPNALGLFAPVNAVFGLSRVIPNVLLTYTKPGLYFSYGRAGDPEQIIRAAMRISLGITLATIPLVPISQWILSYLVVSWAPEYTGSLDALRIATLQLVLFAPRVMVAPLSVFKAWWELNQFATAVVLLQFFLPTLLMVVSGPENLVTSVVWGVLLGQACEALVGRALLRRALQKVRAKKLN